MKNLFVGFRILSWILMFGPAVIWMIWHVFDLYFFRILIFPVVDFELNFVICFLCWLIGFGLALGIDKTRVIYFRLFLTVLTMLLLSRIIHGSISKHQQFIANQTGFNILATQLRNDTTEKYKVHQLSHEKSYELSWMEIEGIESYMLLNDGTVLLLYHPTDVSQKGLAYSESGISPALDTLFVQAVQKNNLDWEQISTYSYRWSWSK